MNERGTAWPVWLCCAFSLLLNAASGKAVPSSEKKILVLASFHLAHDWTAKLTDTIQSSFLDLLELLNDILDLAKLESHKLQSLSVKFDPCESIDTARDTTITRKNCLK